MSASRDRNRGNSDYDYLFKIHLRGEAQVGKSCLLKRFASNTYTDSYISTIGVDFNSKNLNVGNKVAKLQVWDVAGQQRFWSSSGSYRGAHSSIVMFDVTDKMGFKDLGRQIEEAKNQAGQDACLILVGAKTDLIGKRTVTKEEAEEFAKDQNMSYFEVSAKDDVGVTELFNEAAKTIMKRLYSKQEAPLKEEKPKNERKDTVLRISSKTEVDMKSFFKLNSGCKGRGVEDLGVVREGEGSVWNRIKNSFVDKGTPRARSVTLGSAHPKKENNEREKLI